MMERRKYPNDPIEEALCELRFEAGREWDLTLPGRFSEKIEDEYPGKPRQQNVMEAGFPAVSQPEGPTIQLKGSFAKVQFPTEDERRLVAIGPDVLSVHVLSPYPYWEDFYPRIERAFSAYTEVAKPKAVRSISIRYINRVLIDAPTVEIDQYFRTVPQTPPEIPLTMSGFLSRVESKYQDKPIQLVTTLASIDAPENHVAFLLDLEVTRNWFGETLPLEEAMIQVRELRERERVAFEASITDRTREVFNAG